MYERFTDRARNVMRVANHEARRFNHEHVGTEHILLGLVKEATGGLLRWFRRPGGVASWALQALGADLDAVRCEVQRVLQDRPGHDGLVKGRRSLNPGAKKSLELAIEEARQLGHPYVGTEHLLLGLLREKEGGAAIALARLGLRLDDVRLEVLNCLRPAK